MVCICKYSNRIHIRVSALSLSLPFSLSIELHSVYVCVCVCIASHLQNCGFTWRLMHSAWFRFYHQNDEMLIPFLRLHYISGGILCSIVTACGCFASNISNCFSVFAFSMCILLYVNVWVHYAMPVSTLCLFNLFLFFPSFILFVRCMHR